MPEQLPDDWRPPGRVWLKRQWNDHPRHDELVELDKERYAIGDRRWELVCAPDPEDRAWKQVWLRPDDPTDMRSAILVASWPYASEEQALRDAMSIADEHTTDQHGDDPYCASGGGSLGDR